MNQEWWIGTVYYSSDTIRANKMHEIFESEAEAKDWKYGQNDPYISPAREIDGPFTLKEILRKALNK